MAEENDAQEKSHEPTAKRLADARRKGQIARSRELTTTMLLMMSLGIIIVSAPYTLNVIHHIFTAAFAPPIAVIQDPTALAPLFLSLALEGLKGIAPLLAVSAIAAVLGSVAIGGFSFSPESLGFKWERIDPVKGLKRVFSARGLMELVKALVKFSLVLSVACAVMWVQADELLNLGQASLNSALAASALLLAKGVFACASVLILVAMVDAPFQLWDHNRKLKMSREQVKDENKETEGRPEVKARIRQIQQEMARQRMMQEVPNADVIITNPTHFAVALRYQPGKSGAPLVVARGADVLAQRIRETGTAHGVLIVSSPLLARAIYFSTRAGEEIPVELYQAVAQILAWVFGLKAGERNKSDIPTQLAIPKTHHFDERGRQLAGADT